MDDKVREILDARAGSDHLLNLSGFESVEAASWAVTELRDGAAA